jgi:hypothetical protein
MIGARLCQGARVGKGEWPGSPGWTDPDFPGARWRLGELVGEAFRVRRVGGGTVARATTRGSAKQEWRSWGRQQAEAGVPVLVLYQEKKSRP